MNAAKQTWRLSEMRRPFEFAVALQVGLLVFTSRILDGGDCAQLCLIAIVGYWLMVWGIAARRRNALTGFDVVLIRSGFLLWLLTMVLVAIGIGFFRLCGGGGFYSLRPASKKLFFGGGSCSSPTGAPPPPPPLRDLCVLREK